MSGPPRGVQAVFRKHPGAGPRGLSEGDVIRVRPAAAPQGTAAAAPGPRSPARCTPTRGSAVSQPRKSWPLQQRACARPASGLGFRV